MGIEVPQADIRNGVVRTYVDSRGEPFERRSLTKGLLDVKCSRMKPSTAYIGVNYRGYYFYIDDTDVDSKDTFALIAFIFSLRSGETRDRSSPDHSRGWKGGLEVPGRWPA